MGPRYIFSVHLYSTASNVIAGEMRRNAFTPPPQKKGCLQGAVTYYTAAEFQCPNCLEPSLSEQFSTHLCGARCDYYDWLRLRSARNGVC